MRRLMLVLVTLLIINCIILSACKPKPPPIAAPEPQPHQMPAPAPEPEPQVTLEPETTPTISAIPYEEILASRFGISQVDQDIDEISSLGIRWAKPLALPSGPFIWNLIEREKGEYSWKLTDGYIQKIQDYNFTVLPIIWPVAEWDQANWGPVDDTEPLEFEQWMGKSRRKPHDMDAYRKFVSASVERYDGDGIDDMPGIKYPIKYWQVGFGPSLRGRFLVFFDGTSQDYLEVLMATYQAVKEADPEAKVLHATMATMWPQQVSFWEPIFEKGSQYFDIASTQVAWPLTEFDHPELNKTELIAMAEGQIPEFKQLLSEHGITKPVWVTNAFYFTCAGITPEELGEIMVRSYITAFTCGADKYFYERFRALPVDLPVFKQASLIDENGERSPAYYGLKTLVEKLDKFTSAEKLAEGQHKFIVKGEAIYVLWGSGEIPEEITGEVTVTDIYSQETRINSSAINLTESPIFVESTP